MRKSIALLAGAAALLSAGAAGASTWIGTGVIPAGASGAGNPVSAKAIITEGVNSLSVVLTNEQLDIRASNQALSGILIDFVSDPTGVTQTVTQSGTLGNLAGNDTITPVVGSPIHWKAFFSGGNVRLTTLSGGAPRDLIVGDIGDLNNGIASPNPYIIGAGTFGLTLQGAGNVQISGVTFQFGTAPEANIMGACTANCYVPPPVVQASVPEPASWAMMIMGFGLSGAIVRRRRAAAAAA